MNRKSIAILTLILFTFLSCRTYVGKVVNTTDIPTEGRESIKVLGVVTTDDKWIEFEYEPGRIVLNTIVGEVGDESGGLKRISIPLSEIKRVWLRKFSPLKFAWNYILVPAGVAFIAGVIVFIFSDPFCPFIYSFDGTSYTMEAEPFAGAIGPGFKKTEWTVLRSLAEVDHQYRLLVVNELDKADHLDHLKLLVVDHPRETRVFPGVTGIVHTISHPVVPLRAYDREGRDLVPYVSKDDGTTWQWDEESSAAARTAEPKTELVFVFPKPADATVARIIFKGCNTLWGAGIIRRHLELYGKQAPAVLEEIKTQGQAFTKIKDLIYNEEFLSLQLRVNTEAGWETRGIIPGGSPLAPAARVYPLDLAGVPGDTLEIKLTPPAASWMIDYIAVDYSGDVPVKVTGLPMVKCVGDIKDSSRVKKQLAQEDNHYLTLSPRGASIRLIFDAPPLEPGLERTVILETSGYYDIHLDPTDKPRPEILKRIEADPGFLLQYELNEYLHR